MLGPLSILFSASLRAPSGLALRRLLSRPWDCSCCRLVSLVAELEDLTNLCVLTIDVSKAMSITWLVLVLPATFAEVIGLSLVKPGKDGYLDVQVYTGFMFIGAFVSSKSRPPLF